MASLAPLLLLLLVPQTLAVVTPGLTVEQARAHLFADPAWVAHSEALAANAFVPSTLAQVAVNDADWLEFHPRLVSWLSEKWEDPEHPQRTGLTNWHKYTPYPQWTDLAREEIGNYIFPSGNLDSICVLIQANYGKGHADVPISAILERDTSGKRVYTNMAIDALANVIFSTGVTIPDFEAKVGIFDMISVAGPYKFDTLRIVRDWRRAHMANPTSRMGKFYIRFEKQLIGLQAGAAKYAMKTVASAWTDPIATHLPTVTMGKAVRQAYDWLKMSGCLELQHTTSIADAKCACKEPRSAQSDLTITMIATALIGAAAVTCTAFMQFLKQLGPAAAKIFEYREQNLKAGRASMARWRKLYKENPAALTPDQLAAVENQLLGLKEGRALMKKWRKLYKQNRALLLPHQLVAVENEQEGRAQGSAAASKAHAKKRLAAPDTKVFNGTSTLKPSDRDKTEDYHLATITSKADRRAGKVRGYTGLVWARLKAQWEESLRCTSVTLASGFSVTACKFDHAELLKKAVAFRSAHDAETKLVDKPVTEAKKAKKAKKAIPKTSLEAWLTK